jgi:WD40 repeat protein
VAAPAADEAAIKQLIADLGGKTAAVRDAAQKRLIEIGLASRPALLTAAKSDDPEVRARALAALKDLVEVTVKDLGQIRTNPSNLILSPNGEHVAYMIYPNDKLVLVWDGKEGPEWDRIDMANVSSMYVGVSPFSRDGSLAYSAKKGEKSYIVVTGQENKALELPEHVVGLVRSPDGKHMAYPVRKGSQDVMTCDGKEGLPYRMVSFGMFSPDSQTLAYEALTGKDEHLWVVGGRPLGPYEHTSVWAFSPDSKRFAFVAWQKARKMVVCDGKAGAAYDSISFLVFSPDSRNLAYVGHNDQGADQGSSIILNEKKVGSDEIGQAPAFSPNSRQLAWTTYDDEVHGLDVITGKTAPVVAKAGFSLAMPAFSPDGKHLALIAESRDGKFNVVVDGKFLPPTFEMNMIKGGGEIPWLYPPGFSADGRHVFFKATTSATGRKAFMVIDGVSRPEHDSLWIPDDLKNHPESLRYIVRDGDRLRLVETYWPEDRTWEKAVEKAKE